MLDQMPSTTPDAAFRRVTHVIFDLDGLLLDTEGVYRDVISDIAIENGKLYTDDIRVKVLGTPDVISANIAITEMNLPMTTDEFLGELRSRSRYMFKTYSCELMPGAERLVRHFYNSQIPIAVATSSTQESFDVKTEKHKDLFSLFHHIVTGGSDPEVKRGKPNPDIFLICASRFPDNPKPEQCLVFEDAPNGITAAITAGMQCVMVPDPENILGLTNKTAPTQLLHSLKDVKLELFGLPSLKAE